MWVGSKVLPRASLSSLALLTVVSPLAFGACSASDAGSDASTAMGGTVGTGAAGSGGQSSTGDGSATDGDSTTGGAASAEDECA
jgi:hypothetical protein